LVNGLLMTVRVMSIKFQQKASTSLDESKIKGRSLETTGTRLERKRYIINAEIYNKRPAFI
jgi:hypothetical protein